MPVSALGRNALLALPIYRQSNKLIAWPCRALPIYADRCNCCKQAVSHRYLCNMVRCSSGRADIVTVADMPCRADIFAMRLSFYWPCRYIGSTVKCLLGRSNISTVRQTVCRVVLRRYIGTTVRPVGLIYRRKYGKVFAGLCQYIY